MGEPAAWRRGREGSLPCMADTSTQSIVIDAPPDRVAAVICDFPRYPEWAAAVKSVEADDRVLMVLPMFHIYALNGTLTAIARAAATAVLAERFDPELTLGLVRSAGVTNIVGAPQMYAAWADRPGLRDALSGVRLLFTGAAPMPQALLEKIGEQTDLPVHEGYGLTEAAPGVASTLVTGRPKPGTVGRPFAGVEVRLVDDGDDNDRDGEGDEVGEGDPGEIWIKGDNLFSGYWYATGDVAYKDNDGDLVLVDRQKELIIVNGFNVYPREVEEAIKALDDVVEAAVVGVADPRTGEAVKAYVETREGSSLTPDDVVSFIANRLARFKWPSAVEFVETLPHTATGKVAKGKLQGSVPARDDT